MKKLFLMTILAMWCGIALANVKEYWLPQRVEGVKQPKLLLNGKWQFRVIEGANEKWEKIEVPGEAAMQGFAIEHDKAYLYKKSFEVPAEFTNKRIILRFDGVYSHALLKINGKTVREHHGGFTRWESDITELVKIGKKNELELEVTDRLDDISYASGYAHHPIGGILRDVTLYALPATHLSNVTIETPLDSTYKNGILKLKFDAISNGKGKVNIQLKGSNGEKWNAMIALNQSGCKTYSHEMEIKQPLKWDAEHPNLYTLEVTVSEEEKEVCKYNRQVGFRTIEVKGNQMQVNGKQIKLRGACRHDIHPTLGRTTTHELDSLDVVLMKRSNQNFVRTSHYPPTERFIEFCDRMGIYVECETAICFVNTYRQKNYAPGSSENDVNFRERYLGQLQEMVFTHRNHASVLFWSIGNESIYGSNFQASYDWVKKEDETRPVIFSYPGSAPSDKKVYDLMSMHYQNVAGDVHQFGIGVTGYQVKGYPVIFDEWAHVPCYTYATLREDPNIREFWGETLDKMWSGLFKAPGGLGGAIWGFIDETFMVPTPQYGKPFWIEFARTAKPENYQGNCVGYGEWGIIDVWRREKPEFWGTKKAYSPIRVLNEKISDYFAGAPIVLEVFNRFDHTDLNEVKLHYIYKGKEKKLALPSITPHNKGFFTIPGEEWERGEELTLLFKEESGELIDAYTLSIGNPCTKNSFTKIKGNLTLEENNDYFIIKGNDCTIPINKHTGLIEQATAGKDVVIANGPYVYIDVNLNHLTGAEVRKTANNFKTKLTTWKLNHLNCEKKGENIVVTINGNYEGVEAIIGLTVTSEGEIDCYYQTTGEPNGYLREVGLRFDLGDTFDKLAWKRKGYWNYYPKGHFAGNRGETKLYNKHQVKYGENPKQEWNLDTHNYYYFADAGSDCKQPLTNMAKGMKEHIEWYKLNSEKSELTVYSPTRDLACRINKEKDNHLFLQVNNRWDYPEIAWGDYCKTLPLWPTVGSMKLHMKRVDK